MAGKIERVPTLEPFTVMEKLVTALVARNCSYKEVGKRLSISHQNAKWHADNAAAKIPGDLPTQCKLTFWWRGATLEMLIGGDGMEPESPSESIVKRAAADRESGEAPWY